MHIPSERRLRCCILCNNSLQTLTEEYNARRSHFLLPLAVMVGATMYVIKYKKRGKGKFTGS